MKNDETFVLAFFFLNSCSYFLEFGKFHPNQTQTQQISGVCHGCQTFSVTPHSKLFFVSPLLLCRMTVTARKDTGTKRASGVWFCSCRTTFLFSTEENSELVNSSSCRVRSFLPKLKNPSILSNGPSLLFSLLYSFLPVCHFCLCSRHCPAATLATLSRTEHINTPCYVP